MNTFNFYVVTFLLLIFVSNQASAKDYKIIFIGDSITQGAANLHYRCYLLNMLKSTGHNFDSVGSQNSGEANCDADHEGHSGWKANDIILELPAWAHTYNPDIALVHIGTNDIWRGENAESTAVEISEIVAILQEANPNIVIFVAGIIPLIIENRNEEVKVLNTLLKGYVEFASTEFSKVIYVEQHTDFNLNNLPDGVHPNSAGASEMALRWFKALQEFFKSNN